MAPKNTRTPRTNRGGRFDKLLITDGEHSAARNACKDWRIDNVEVHTSYSKTHALDCEDCESSNAKIDTFHREIKITGDFDDKQLKRLLQIADKCPVHKTLHSETQVITEIIP